MKQHLGPNPHLKATFTAPKRTTLQITRRILKYILPYKLMAIATITCALTSLAFTFVYPWITPYIIDEIIAKQNTQKLPQTILLLIAAFLLREIFNNLRININNRFEQNVIYDMRRHLYQHIQHLPLKYFDQHATGDLMTRIIEDVNAVERLLIDGTEQGTVALLSILGVITILLFKNPDLTLITLITLPLLITGALTYTLTAHKRYRRQRQAAAAINTLLMDNLQGIRQIKAYTHQNHENQRFAHRANTLRQSTLAVMKAWALYSPSMAFTNSLGTALILWIGGLQVIQQTITIGELLGFLFFLNLLYDPISRLHALNQMMQAARAAGERILHLLDQQPERPNRTAKLPPLIRGAVQYQNIHFQYHNKQPTLTNINLTAQPGQTIALVGHTGAGKTTLLNLLPAFYEPTKGNILIDNHNTNNLNLKSLRSHITLLTQEPFLFNGTIRENILYGNLNATQKQLHNATHAANCHTFIQKLPQQYDTHIGERGIQLSLGEKQRITIARALLRNTPILILDEPTASIDTHTEHLIQQAIQTLIQNRTTFIIAHRLTTIRNAHQILVLHQGQIIEQGTHQTLLQQNGTYAQLTHTQTNPHTHPTTKNN